MDNRGSRHSIIDPRANLPRCSSSNMKDCYLAVTRLLDPSTFNNYQSRSSPLVFVDRSRLNQIRYIYRDTISLIEMN